MFRIFGPRAVAAVAAACFLLDVSGAAAAPQWAAPVSARGPVTGDGGRYAAWQSTDGSTTLFDSRTGTTTQIATPDGLQLIGTGGGYVAWQDPTPDTPLPTVEVREIASGTSRPGAPRKGAGLCADEGVLVFNAVGRSGLSGFCAGKGSVPAQYNWRSGLVGSPDSSITTTEDLSSSKLNRSICRPFQRSSAPDGSLAGPVLVPLLLRGPLGLTYRPLSVARTAAGLWGRIELLRCRRSAIELDRGLIASGSLGVRTAGWLKVRSAGSGLVRLTARAYDTRTKHMTSWPTVVTESTATPTGGVNHLVLAGDLPLLSTPTNDPTTPYRVRAGALTQ